MNSRSTVAFIRSPRQFLQSDTGVPHFALDPLTYRCLLSLSPTADFAEPRPPRHTYSVSFDRTDKNKVSFGTAKGLLLFLYSPNNNKTMCFSKINKINRVCSLPALSLSPLFTDTSMKQHESPRILASNT